MKKVMKTLLCLAMALVCATSALLPSAYAAKATKILRVNNSGVRLHYTAEGRGEENMIFSMDKGTKVMYLGMKNKSWAKVVLNNGLEGYVYKGYLSEYGAVATKSVYQVEAKAPTYKLSGKKLKKSGSLAKGTIVIVRDTKNGYAHVMTLNGKKTYIKTSALKKYN